MYRNQDSGLQLVSSLDSNLSFHQLERTLPDFGKGASTHWKECFQTLEESDTAIK